MGASVTSAAPTDQTGLIPLSFNQDFLCAFDKGDAEGAFGPRHTLSNGWRLAGPIRLDSLWQALHDLVERHETLRTSIVRGGEQRQQVIHRSTAPALRLHDLSTVDLQQRERR